ncbi:MAG: disulfide bond formation protein B [Parcubacteria group bacterium CG11_big_fil_rev_8_21_14_0_20_39_22]|nr:MAG: disulfide bond formation protein B [Parcubacteria group bacterium CG11_big_fil_rev_8_21_14_0_20_39_22]
MQTTYIVNTALSSLTLVAEILVLFLIVSLFLKKDSVIRQKTAKCLPWLAFATALIATLGSLTYSEIIGYEPCKLCWLQRIFMYPLAIIFAIALIKREFARIIPYALTLSIPGILIAISHYYLQITGSSIFPCSAVGYSAACSQRFVLQFGHITIPFMAMMAFAVIILSLTTIYKNRES